MYVVSLPRLPGVYNVEERRRIQPRLGSKVYTKDGSVGTVSEIVINPRNRLVSHHGVSVESELQERIPSRKLVVAVAQIDFVREESTFLSLTRRDFQIHPQFREEDFPVVSQGWRPPFPYTHETVRWPCEGLIKDTYFDG